MTPTSRVHFEPVEGAAALFTPAFNELLTALHDRLHARALALRAARARLLDDALRHGRLPAPLPPGAASGDWTVPPVPQELRKPGIEISGPCSITSMFINALNPGPEGERAEGDLDDDEDSGGHRLVDTVRAAHNRLAAVNRELYVKDAERNRDYKIAPACTSTSRTCASTERP
jgi:malate synthase